MPNAHLSGLATSRVPGEKIGAWRTGGSGDHPRLPSGTPSASLCGGRSLCVVTGRRHYPALRMHRQACHQAGPGIEGAALGAVAALAVPFGVDEQRRRRPREAPSGPLAVGNVRHTEFNGPKLAQAIPALAFLSQPGSLAEVDRGVPNRTRARVLALSAAGADEPNELALGVVLTPELLRRDVVPDEAENPGWAGHRSSMHPGKMAVEGNEQTPALALQWSLRFLSLKGIRPYSAPCHAAA